jgi:membrane protein
MRAVIEVLRAAGSRWIADRAPKMAAALAFYTSFALAPVLLVAIGLAGLVFGDDVARERMLAEIASLTGPDTAKAVAGPLEALDRRNRGGLASLLGLAALFVGASGVFAELQDSLNVVWKVRKRPGRGLLGTFRDRFLSFTMVLGLGFLLLVSLVVSAGLSALADAVGGPARGTLLRATELLASFLVLAALFAFLFRFLPDARTPWRPVILGGAVTALLFNAGKFAIGAYLGTSAVASPYGAAGAFVLVLLWVYYSSQILFFGAELTHAVALRLGTPPLLKADAVGAPRAYPLGDPAPDPPRPPPGPGLHAGR